MLKFMSWKFGNYYVSTHKIGRHIVFSLIFCKFAVCLSICLSVSHTFMSAFFSFEPLMDLQITAQMSSMMSMFDQVWFKVKVIVETLYDCIMCLLYNSWKVDDILKWLATKVKYHQTHFSLRSLQDQGYSLRSNKLSCLLYISFEPLVRFTNNSAQMSSKMSQCAMRMTEQGQL